MSDRLEFHAFANVFPLMEGEALEALIADVKANGVVEPIELYEGKILDGRNRYLASIEAGVHCPSTVFNGADALGHVISLNLHRRHLDESQRAMVAARVATLKDGQRADRVQGLPIGRASQMLNVGERTVARAREVLEQGAAELTAAVEQGKISVSAAADVASLPQDEQREIVARGEREILQRAKEIRAGKAEVRRVERVQNIAEISKGNAALGTAQRYPVIYADPPWKYENPPMGGSNRSIENHYPTMTLEEICALPVGDVATEDAVLFLWATSPKLAECMTVITAWGFNYRTCMVWVKDKIGMGYHVRNQHEILLIAKRGEVPPPPVDARPSSVLNAPRDEHSAKPHEFYALIDRMYPELAKIELFSRTPQEGWAVWGNQADAA